MTDKEKIDTCMKCIESLKGMLKIVGSGAIAIITLFVFFKEEFSPIIAKSLLLSVGLLIVLILFLIFRKYAIIEKINLKRNNHDS